MTSDISRKHIKPPPTMTKTLRPAIAESSLSFADLARRIGVSRQSLMKFARGEQTIRLDGADKLAEVLGPKRIAQKAICWKPSFASR